MLTLSTAAERKGEATLGKTPPSPHAAEQMQCDGPGAATFSKEPAAQAEVREEGDPFQSWGLLPSFASRSHRCRRKH